MGNPVPEVPVSQFPTVTPFGLVLFAGLLTGCPNPKNPLGPPVEPPVTPASAIAFAIGGPGADLVRAVVTDAAGNVFVTGEFTGTADFDPSDATHAFTSLGGTDLFLARYSPIGELTWVVRIGDAPDESVTALAIDNAGNLVLGGSFVGTVDFDPEAGVTTATSNGGRDGFVASYTPAGAFRWVRTVGGPADDAVLDVAAQAGGVIFASGTFSGTAVVDPAQSLAVTSAGGVDGFLASWSPTGTARWAFSVGGPGDDAASAVAAGAGGSVYLGGAFTGTADFGPGTETASLTSPGGLDGFLARYSDGGALTWLQGLSGPDNVEVTRGGLAVGTDGAVYAGGTFAGTADFDGGSGVAARTSNGLTDGFLVRYEAAGTFGWVVAIGGPNADLIRGVATAPSGDAVITGSFSGTARFDPGAGAASLTAIGLAGATDAFTAQYGPTGGFRWAVGLGAPVAGSESGSFGAAVAVDGNGFVFTGGQFFGAADADPGSGLVVLTSLGGADGFVVKYTGSGALATRP